MKKLFFVFLALCCGSAGARQAPVTLSETADSYVLDNGIVKAVITRKTGNISSFLYKGRELLTLRSDRPGAGAMWSHDATSEKMQYAVTIDPKKNNGARAEVSIKGISEGRPMGNGPGGSFIADIEIRFALAKGESGLYTYCTFDHLPEYPASNMGEARFVAFLDPGFDWMSTDAKRSGPYKLPPGGFKLTKYTLTANQHENPVFGWINSTDNIGFWCVNSSMEYMSGGITKVDFLCHRDTRVDGAPVFLNYWRSSHYGGSTVYVEKGERWTKTIGPILLYANQGKGVDEVRKDAFARQLNERDQWPYAWVNSPDYPLKSARGTVKGRLSLKDPITPAVFSRLRVGLSAPDYPIPQAGAPDPRIVDWQYDAKHYEFWVTGNSRGEFSIPNVRPGKYTLHAIADGVHGEFAKTEILIKAGQVIDLGNLQWIPVRYGKQLWDIGIADRNSLEFLGGDLYWEDDIVKKYPANFPADVNYIIGKSDYRKDWFFEQLPHVENAESPANNSMPETSKQGMIRSMGIENMPEPAKTNAYRTIDEMGRSGKYASGRATPWRINFDLPAALTGKLVLRLAISGTETPSLAVTVNDQQVALLKDLRVDGTPNRSGSSGIWFERMVTFDASLLKKGMNQIVLTIPAGGVAKGVMYDYIRLEHEG